MIENSGCCRKPAIVTRPDIDNYDRAIQEKKQPPAGKCKHGINDRLTSYLPQRIICVVTHRLVAMGVIICKTEHCRTSHEAAVIIISI